MLNCPNCKVQMGRVRNSRGIFWICPGCKGRSSTMSLLRKEVPSEIVNSLWQTAKNVPHPRKRDCPACMNRMAEIPVTGNEKTELLDVCTICQFIWFDPSEYNAIPKKDQEPTFEEKIPQKAREQAAIMKLDLIRQQANAQDWGDDSSPETWWQWIPGLLGMPVESGAEIVARKPLVTWLTTLIVTIISIMAFAEYKSTIYQWGFIPSQMWRYGGLTFLTSFLLHGGIMHLIGNMYFFLVFGDNVEDWLGKYRFIMLLICATIAGNIAHAMGDPRGMIPCIGASGGISGVIAFYALKFPHARLSIMLWIFPFFKWLRMPAYVMFIIWLLFQFYGTYAQLAGFSNVSSLAHLGGAGVGVIFWILCDRKHGSPKHEWDRERNE